jgi:hypothetical protein
MVFKTISKKETIIRQTCVAHLAFTKAYLLASSCKYLGQGKHLAYVPLVKPFTIDSTSGFWTALRTLLGRLEETHNLNVVHQDIHPDHVRAANKIVALIDLSDAEYFDGPVSQRSRGTLGYRLSDSNVCYDKRTADVYATARTFGHYYEQLVHCI